MTLTDMFSQTTVPVADADPELTAALSADFAQFLAVVAAEMHAADVAADAVYMAGYDRVMTELKAKQVKGKPTLH